MSGLEFNKIFAAVLVAGIVASLSGFIAHKVIHPHELHEDAVYVEGSEGGHGGPVKPKMPDPILDLIADADVAKGEKLSKACAICHSFEKGGPNGTGPNLWNIVGRDAGSHGGFAYSEAMAAMEGSWTYAKLNKFLWKPKNYVEGTKMNYIGMKKPEDRAAIIAWLRTLSDSPKPLPSEAEIAAEKAELAPPEPEAEETEESDSEESADAVEDAAH